MNESLTKSQTEVKNHIVYLVKSLDIEDVDVRLENGEHGRVWEVRVEKPERGKIIGKEGRNITALRTMVNAFASRRGVDKRVHVYDNSDN